jgi:hypothetical protein
MPERVYLEWTIENWITVILMVFVGMFAIGMIASAVRHYTGNASLAAASSATGTA